MKRLLVLSVILILLYVLVAKSSLYSGLFKKVSEWASQGVRTLTTGKPQ